jgi:hypothetical protein
MLLAFFLRYLGSKAVKSALVNTYGDSILVRWESDVRTRGAIILNVFFMISLEGTLEVRVGVK